MGYSVKEKAECVGTFRWIEIQFMEMLARWVPTTPEMEIKVVFGRHVWDCAQHADQLGRRAFELRAPLHYTLPAIPEYQSLLGDIAELASTRDRVSAFYGIACPSTAMQYRRYIENTDSLLDEPTVRILENVLRDYGRMSDECDRLAGDGLRVPPTTHLAGWLARGEALVDVVEHGRDNRRARGVPA